MMLMRRSEHREAQQICGSMVTSVASGHRQHLSLSFCSRAAPVGALGKAFGTEDKEALHEA
jgi:hypothetical protein